MRSQTTLKQVNMV